MGYAADTMGTLGIVGGGQLARMTALAARSLGYRVHALDPSASCPVAGLVDRLLVADYDDVAAGLELAKECDVVTVDLEHVAVPLLNAASSCCPVRPGPGVLHVIQDRGRQKQWLDQQGFPLGPYRLATGAKQLRQALEALGGEVLVKAARGGFDGRGQCAARPDSDASQVLDEVGCEHVVVERVLDLKAELSVLVARRPSGDWVAYAPALNHHDHGVLSYSLLPAPLPPPLLARCQKLALDVACGLNVVGLCVVELFLLQNDQLLINEIAPRPHNSYHGSDRAFETSQFEQHVRAVFDLPLGPASPLRPTAMANLLGDLWLKGAPPNFARALVVPTVRVQLYGKLEARRGRKLGHLSAIGPTIDEAAQRALMAREALVATRHSRAAE